MFLLLLLLIPTSVVAVEENCDQSEATFRNCLRKANVNFKVNYYHHVNHTLKDRIPEWQANIDMCGARKSKCFLQTQLIKIMKDYIDLDNERISLNLEEPAYLVCEKEIKHQYYKKCQNAYVDEYGFSLPFIEAQINPYRCMAKYAQKSKYCGKDLARRYARAQEIDYNIVMQLLSKLEGFASFLEQFED